MKILVTTECLPNKQHPT